VSAIPAQFKVPAQPQVNLMPPEVGERRQRTRRRGATVAFLVIFVLLVGAVYGLAWFQKSQAQAAAAAQTERTAELQAEMAQYTEVDAVKAELANADAARQYAASLEIFWPLLYDALGAGMPDTAVVDLYTFTFPPFDASPAVTGSPFGRAPIGQVGYTVKLTAPILAADVENQLNTVPFFERARATVVRIDDEGSAEGESADATTQMWVLEGTVDVNYDILMMRYSPLWFGEDPDDDEDGLEGYYREYFDALINNQPRPTEYPPLPEATPLPFVPGMFGQGAPLPAAPSASPDPSAEASE
jgi:hypothetical protein